jgi:hypothetical protein
MDSSYSSSGAEPKTRPKTGVAFGELEHDASVSATRAEDFEAACRFLALPPKVEGAEAAGPRGLVD